MSVPEGRLSAGILLSEGRVSVPEGRRLSNGRVLSGWRHLADVSHNIEKHVSVSSRKSLLF